MDAYSIHQYFPSRSNDPALNSYINHHASSMIKCAEHGLYSSAYSHLHILYMVFVYIQLYRIAREKPVEFHYCWIGLPSEENDFRKGPDSPFSFSRIKEKTVFRFFRILGVDDNFIGSASAPIKRRNERLHAKGELYCETEADFFKEFSDYVKLMEAFVLRQTAFLDSIYSQQVSVYNDPNFTMTDDEINTNFVGQHYFSTYELLRLAAGKHDIVSEYITNNYV